MQYIREYKRFLFSGCLLVVAVAAALGAPQAALAHELKVDGSMKAVLHTDPDDNPVAGRPMKYILFFNGSPAFDLEHCDCTLRILKDSMQLATTPLQATTATTSEGSFTFTQPGAYTFDVTGSPKTASLFPSFHLDYDVNVISEWSTLLSALPLVGGVIIAAGLIMLGVLFIASKKQTAK